MKIKEILEKLKTYLEENNLEKADDLITEIYSEESLQERLDDIDDILQEITLWIEFKEDKYKNEALDLINNL